MKKKGTNLLVHHLNYTGRPNINPVYSRARVNA